MFDNNLIAKVKEFTETVAVKAEEYSNIFESVKGVILENFGENGLTAFYIMSAALVLFVASRLAKLTFSTIKYLIIPALALAFIGSYFVPYSFFALLPVTVTASSLLLLFKG